MVKGITKTRPTKVSVATSGGGEPLVSMIQVRVTAPQHDHVRSKVEYNRSMSDYMRHLIEKDMQEERDLVEDDLGDEDD